MSKRSISLGIHTHVGSSRTRPRPRLEFHKRLASPNCDPIGGQHMKRTLQVCGLLLLIAFALVACTPAQTPAPPTIAPTSPPPTNTSIPTTATHVPPTATLPPPTSTPDPHVAGADCAACHTAEHKRWSTTLHAADPAAVLLN